MNSKLLNTIENQAKKYFTDQDNISYDQSTKLLFKNINWNTVHDFDEDKNYLHLQSRYLFRLDYYYEQILKQVSMQGQADLNKGEYLDFWSMLDKLEINKYFLKFHDQVIDESNLFNFLSTLKAKIKELNFINKFKLKSIEMIEVKREFRNE